MSLECFSNISGKFRLLKLPLLAFFLLCVCCGEPCFATPTALEGWTYHTWNIADGLPDQSIEAVAQTPDGYLWLGTPHGLARYGGSSFEVRPNGSHTILQEFGVFCLLVSQDGDLWVGSVGGGITRISPNHTDYDYRAGSEGLTVRALYQDEGGTIWAATGHGLYRLSDGRFTPVPALGNVMLTSIVPDGKGGMWLAGVRLFHLSGNHVTEISRPYRDQNAVINALAMTNHHIWVGTSFGLFESDDEQSLKKVNAIGSGVRALYSDSRSMLWIGTMGDGLIARTADGHFFQALNPREPMANGVRSLTETSNGEVWAGTTAGLIRLSNSGMNLFPISTIAGSDFGSIFVDPNGAVWLSAGHLTRLMNGLQEEVHFPRQHEAPIRAFFRDISGATWVGTLGDGCYRFSAQQVQHLSSPRAIRGFLQGVDGTVWIASDDGISKWQRGEWTPFDDPPGFPSGAVRAMALTEDHSLWVGTVEGLYVVRNNQKEDSELSRLLRHQRIWALHAGKNNSLWIGTESGLYVWQGESLIHLTFPLPDLQSRAVLSILQDTRGRVLIAQPGTILRINQTDIEGALERTTKGTSATVSEAQVDGTPEVFNVARETGAEVYGTIPVSSQTDREGGAWYATYLGLVHIGAMSPHRNVQPPQVAIEKILVDGVQMPLGATLRLPPSARNVQIQAVPILLSSRSGLQLRSRLVGMESKWNDMVPNATSIYTRLPPGHYTYRAEANWEAQKTYSFVELEVSQEGPYYRKPWFAVLMFAVLAMVIWLLHALKVHQLHLQFRAVTTERSRVAREIHDTVLQGCIAVYSLLDAYLTGQEDPEENDQFDAAQNGLLNHAREQIAETIGEARTAIWNVRQAEKGESLNALLRDLIQRSVARTHVAGVFEDEGEPIKLDAAIQYEVLMATREAILNALSHANPRNVIVRMSRVGRDRIIVDIIDDGSGFDAGLGRAGDPQHFGLTGLQERLSSLHGTCVIKSTPELGTQVRLEIPKR